MPRRITTFSWLTVGLSACAQDPPLAHDPPQAVVQRASTNGTAGVTTGAPSTAQPAATSAKRDEIARRIALLLPKQSYLEERCSEVDHGGLAARRCTYRRGGAALEVTVAAIPRDTMARWVVEAAAASTGASDLEPLAERLARYVVAQSSGAVPLGGEVWEDMAGDGVGKTYRFDRGVSLSSGTCRPMSLTRAQWCAHVTSETGASPESCLEGVKSPEAWSALCASWIGEALGSGTHPGLRARARSLAAAPRSGP